MKTEYYDVQPPGDDRPIAIDPLIERQEAAVQAFSRPDGIVSMGPSEAQKAESLKNRADKLIVELCALMDEGMRDGLAIRWQNIAWNAKGQHEVVDLHIIKRF